MSLALYRKKRHFCRTTEPKGEPVVAEGARFVVQKHAASHLHYDFRLELDGVLKSWAVPKGPNLNPAVKALAVHVEDHPIEYASFEGTIPEGEYGGGTVIVWDEGTWQPEGDARRAYRKGSLTFRLLGKKLKGRWKLLKMHGKSGADGKNWLLLKLKDEEAAGPDEPPIVDQETKSVTTGRTLEEIARNSGQASHSRNKRKASRKSDAVKTRSRRKTSRAHPGTPDGARRAKMPKTIRPQLATLVQEAPSGDDWIFELKFDGYRLIARKEKRQVVLLTRAGHDWTHRFPSVARAVADQPVDQAMIDGEVVIIGPNGTTDFQALQNLLRRGSDDNLVYYAFDIPYYDGLDLTQSPLIERKQLLKKVVEAQGEKDRVIRYSDHLRGSGARILEHACRSVVEGMMAKRIDSHYEGKRTTNWVKLKCSKRQEFVIGGWSEPSGARERLGALLLGYYRTPREFTYCGRVGTGFTAESLADLGERLARLDANEPPFVNPPAGRAARDVHWVEPKLVAEIEFGAWTRDGILRHAAFLGLREDKNAQEVSREIAREQPNDRTRKARAASRASDEETDRQQTNAKVRLTHPDRVLYPEAGITKRELAAYYESIADWILPHLVHRPLSIVRCPEGRQGACFFQRHLGRSMPAPIRGIEVREKDGKQLCLAIDDAAGLVALAQIGALEIHPWGSREYRLDRPDRLIFDLDPGAGVTWGELVRAARDVRDRLKDLHLTSFVRTTGGKGLHIVVPIARTVGWEPLKAFSRAFSSTLERDAPKRYVATASKAGRTGRIYIDYLRNEQGATAIASYSTRARPGATVATPLRWQELREDLDPQTFDIRTVARRLARRRLDPWDGFFELRQPLPKSSVPVKEDGFASSG